MYLFACLFIYLFSFFLFICFFDYLIYLVNDILELDIKLRSIQIIRKVILTADISPISIQIIRKVTLSEDI